jgi:L-threonylcarbamoyladenylate synthase
MDPRVATAARALHAGALVVYPTDTLWGLGANARSAAAIARLTAAKGRPEGMPISVALSSFEEIETWADLNAPARSWIRTHLPGPWTIVAHASARAQREFPEAVLGSGRTLGIRIPDHPVARKLAQLVGPITCTSANRHGEPPSPSITRARAVFGKAVRVYLAAPPAPAGQPSTIANLTRDVPILHPRR